MTYRLLEAFRGLFQGKRYQHRDSSLGDWVSYHLYEDLYSIGRSRSLVASIESRERVLCVANRRQGIAARRGDGTFGEIVPGVTARLVPGFVVARGPVANVEIGAEAKILAKAMIKQIDRVISDLRKQVDEFRRGGGSPICVGIVGINQAQSYTSYEGEVRCPNCGEAFPLERPTDGRRYPHPFQEAAAAESRLIAEAKPAFDEFMILRYRAPNRDPYVFEWVNYDETFRNYGAILVRVSRAYESRFGSRSR
ncbi:MAG TPA: hypothetical protein VNN07_12015 [Candidatus Tectomicrobia bacterium]|nr:hypothetical protein [Candidatus Tectomicrobia bacterium]